MKFKLAVPESIVFETGASNELGQYLHGMGKKALLLHGTSLSKTKTDAIIKSLNEYGIDCVCHVNPSHEPDTDMVDFVVENYINNACDFIIAIGGGSVIDTGKAASGIVTNGGKLKDYLEGVGIGRKIINVPVPFVAIPTTHGTGAEATKNAVIGSASEFYKKSIRDERLLPDKVIIDAELMLSLPKKQTAYCSMDALTQLIEAYTSVKSNIMTDALCISGLKTFSKGIYRAYDNGNDVEAREYMAYASLVSGICLANAGLGAVHGIAPALGITYGISHGESCALMLDHVMKLNLPYAVKKYADVGRILNSSDNADDEYMANTAVEYVKNLKNHMNIPCNLKHLNINENDIDVLLNRCSSNSMNANPVKLEKQILVRLIKSIM